MITDSSVNIIRDICKLMSDYGDDCAQWRIGAAANVDQVLFVDQGLARNYPWQICRRAPSADEARAIVDGFRNLSCEECPGGRDRNQAAVYVYAYLKTPGRLETANHQQVSSLIWQPFAARASAFIPGPIGKSRRSSTYRSRSRTHVPSLFLFP